MSNTDDQRAAFEAWAKSHRLLIATISQDDRKWYADYVVQCSWLAWQAAIEHAKKTMCNRS